MPSCMATSLQFEAFPRIWAPESLLLCLDRGMMPMMRGVLLLAVASVFGGRRDRQTFIGRDPARDKSRKQLSAAYTF